MKKLVCLFLSITVVLMLGTTAFAASGNMEAENGYTQNYHVSFVNPMEQITARGTTYPTTAWNVVTQGVYTFSGNAQHSTLYLSYLLYGTTLFEATVTNKSAANDLTVNPHDSTDLMPFTVSKDSTVTKYYMLKDGKTYFLLSFNAPSYFSGSASEWVYQ